MAWGGLEEQAHEWELGNVYAKDWQDEALKIIKKAMAKYWQSCSTVSKPPEATATTSETPDAKIIHESEFDCHHCFLIAQSAQTDDTGGWAAELD